MLYAIIRPGSRLAVVVGDESVLLDFDVLEHRHGCHIVDVVQFEFDWLGIRGSERRDSLPTSCHAKCENGPSVIVGRFFGVGFRTFFGGSTRHVSQIIGDEWYINLVGKIA